MMTTASLRTVLVAAVGLLFWLHVLQLWHLYLLAFAFGAADAFAGPAAQAFLPSLVQRDQMVATFAVVQTTAQITTIAAPAPAGLIIKALGIAWAFFIDAISFLFIIGALWRLPDPPVAAAPGAKPSVWNSILEGIGFVGKDVPLRSLILVASVMNFCIVGPMGVGLAYLVKTRFGSPSAYGIAIASAAAGGLLGSLLAGVLKVRRRGLLILSAGVALAMCIGSIGLLGRFWVLAGILLVMGATAGVTNIHIGAWIQQRIKPETRGRVSSVLALGTLGLLPVSMAVAGLLVAWNLSLMFVLAGAALLIVVAAAAMHETVRQIE
jgi:MFS family permease